MPTCPALTACGGDVVGSWEYDSGCVSTDTLFGTARQVCTGLTLTNMTGDSRGSVVFNATTVLRSITTNLSGTANLPAACNPTSNCTQVQSALASGFKTLSCTAAGAGCACDFTVLVSTTGSSPYTKGTNQVTTDPGTSSATTYDYCIAGAAFTYQELGTTPRDPGIFKMTKK